MTQTQSSQRKQRAAISPLREEDFPGWYQEVVRQAELATMAHVRGCMVIRPWGYGIWSRMQQTLDEQIRASGHENVYFPLFIPLSYLQKEADHVEGFAKEMAVVTHHRLQVEDGKLVPAGKLEEPVVVRPTSETIFGQSMSEWIESYRDLPLKLNQWANVVRWEMRPRVFLRTTEFLWQEGHTAHASEEEAMVETLDMHEMYRSFAEDWAAIPVVPGEKSPSERFPGAERTFTIEAMMQDGKALQAGTSHYLGQNFAHACNIAYLSSAGTKEFAYTTSWGVSTRMVGALIMTHGDDDGLCVPPALAPHQIVIVPMTRGTDTDDAILEYARRLVDALSSIVGPRGDLVRVSLDDRLIRSADKKWQWIKKGVPLLVELGTRDRDSQTVSFRSRLSPHESRQETFEAFVNSAAAELDIIQSGLYERARKRLEEGIRRDIETMAEAVEFFTSDERGLVLAGWCGKESCELALKPQAVTIRCLPTAEADCVYPCLIDGIPGRAALWGQSY